MPRYRVAFLLRGSVEIDARDEEMAQDIFNAKTAEDLSSNVEYIDVDALEQEEDYKE